jgi:hypothetical protein
VSKTFWWIGLAGALLVAAWLLRQDHHTFLQQLEGSIQYEAWGPWAIGDEGDAFAYAGKRVRAIEGTASLRFDPDTGRGLLECTLAPDPDLVSRLTGDGETEHSVVLRMAIDHADYVWTDRTIHGDTRVGDSRLPGTFATFAGSGTFEVLLDDALLPDRRQGFWSIAHALRQSDGAIRNQGLVFSPLLRDRSRFSNPDRIELTLLVYASEESDDVVLHLVFPDVRSIDTGNADP